MSLVWIWGLILILMFIVPISIRLFFVVPYLILSSLVPLIFVCAVAIFIPLDKFNEQAYILKKRQRFNFYKRANWEKNVKQLEQQLDVSEEKKIYPDNFIINETLNNLISLVLRDFVESWFSRISPDKTFIVSIRHEFKYMIKIIQQRCADVDFANLIVHNLIPIFNDHIEAFLSAQEITRNKKIINKSSNPTDKAKNINDDSILAHNYKRGNLHRSIKINSVDQNFQTKKHLSSMVDKILPFILEEKELNSAPAKILICELLSSCVLNPVCNMLSESDFYNQIIVSSLSKQIKDRNDVKRLRSVLRRHSMNNISLNDDPDNDVSAYKLTPDTSRHEFDALLKLIDNTTDKSTLLKYKYYTILQSKKLMQRMTTEQIDESKPVQKYMKRLNKILELLDSKLNKRPEQFKNKSDSVILTSKTPTLSKDFTLHEILCSPTKLKYFVSYMDTRGDRRFLIDFWISAEALRNPLEYTIFSKPKDNKLDITEEDEESSDEDLTMFLDDDFTQASDIKIIFDKFFNQHVMKIPPKIFYKVSEFLEGNSSNKLAYLRARKSIFKLQEFEYLRLKQSDFVAFKSSDIWLKLLVEDAVNEDENYTKVDTISSDTNSFKILQNTKDNDSNESLNENSYGDPLAKYSEVENTGKYVDVNMTGKVSDKVVKAVEDALNEIMKDNETNDINLDLSNDKRNSRLVSDDVAKDLFGGEDNESLFAGTDDESTQPSTLFSGNDTSNMNSSCSSINLDAHHPEIKTASPNVLNLSSHINQLTVEIEKLQQQRIILQTLLKKAEIINNVPELRILKKSLISLDKELKLKSVQKEQFIVQDRENSLYESSKVNISDYIKAKDKNGKDFIMYVIEVTKLSALDHKTPIANWMVTRRFSQFYELHIYLKSKFPEVESMDFPKKKMVMKFRQESLILERQQALKKYLQLLIKNKQVCSDRIFRDFLSSETFDVSCDNKLNHLERKKNKNNDGSGTKLYNIISSQALYPLLSLTNYKGINDQTNEKLSLDKNLKDSQILSDIENEDTISQESNVKDVTFVKPICDLVISIFQLNSSTSWLRGKALIILFQQIFGSTVEKVLRANIDGKIKHEECISNILTGLQSSLWPDGTFRKSKPPRTQIEKNRSKEQAKQLLHIFINDTCSKIFGQNASNEGANILYLIFQNEILNRHLVLSILDECLSTIFPEIS